MTRKIILPLAILLLAAGGHQAAVRRFRAVAPAGASFLALGDSYTIGESVPAAARFPAQTALLLRNKGMEVSDPVYIARTGWTTADLQAALTAASLSPGYRIVTLLIGVNDQYQGLDSAGYRARFSALLHQAIGLAGGRKHNVYVLSIPDYGITPFGGGSGKISREIDCFNSINKEITQAEDVTYLNITPISRQTDKELIAGDGLHPSAKQYALWAQLLAAAIR